MSEDIRRLVSGEIEVAIGATPPSEFRIFKTGKTDTDYGPYLYDEESARLIAERELKRQRKPFMDYEHQSLNDPPIEAPAAATYDLDYRVDGLWAINVDWRPRAVQYLTEREYFSISPAFTFDKKSSRVTELINIALTNRPGTWAQEPLVAATEKLYKELKMESVFKALGIAADADESVALTEAARLTDIKRQLLTLTERQETSEAVGVLTAWKESHDSVKMLREEVSTLKAASEAREIEDMLSDAEKIGKLTPAKHLKLTEKVTAGELNKSAIRALVETLEVLETQKPAVDEIPVASIDNAFALSDADIAMAEATGTNIETMKKYLEKRAAQKGKVS